MVIFQPPVNFCSDENIQTIFLQRRSLKLRRA
jgi:hypothetical protein